MRKEKLMDFINVLLNDEPDLSSKYFEEISALSVLIQKADEEELENALENR